MIMGEENEYQNGNKNLEGDRKSDSEENKNMMKPKKWVVQIVHYTRPLSFKCCSLRE
jgi:hypothetical protein